MEEELAKLNTNKGITVKDVSSEEFIKAFATYLKKSGKFEIPEWTQYVKTGCFKELSPYDPDWLYVRGAAIARQVYMRRHVGITSLSDKFGGSQRRGVAPNIHRRGARKIIRHCLQQLTKMDIIGLVKIDHEDGGSVSDGRAITRKDITDMDRIAYLLKKQTA